VRLYDEGSLSVALMAVIVLVADHQIRVFLRPRLSRKDFGFQGNVDVVVLAVGDDDSTEKRSGKFYFFMTFCIRQNVPK
jgi:hypothetical protein